MKTTAIIVLISVISLQAIEQKLPTVLVTLLVRNKATILPYALTYLEKLRYPKDRIALWIRSDHNEDISLEVNQISLSLITQQSSLYLINLPVDLGKLELF